MISLYVLPHHLIASMITLLAVVILCQTVTLVCSFFSFRYSRHDLYISLINAVILAHLLLLITCVVECNYRSSLGLIADQDYGMARVILFVLLLLLSLMVFWSSKGDVLPLGIPAIAVLTLPAVERAVGNSFPLLLMISIFLWLFHGLYQISLYIREHRKKLSVHSVKEAVDSLNFGLLFYRDGAMCKGQILVSNLKMQELMFVLTGQNFNNGHTFYDMLLRDQVLPECVPERLHNRPAFILPNGQIWEFELQHLNIDHKRCVLLTASDMTQAREAISRLYEQQRQLEQRNKELQVMLDNLESVCRSEELIHIKGRVHDLLGQRISLLLRSVIEHKKPDEELLAAFADGLPEDLKQVPDTSQFTLDMLVKDFENLGVNVHTQGQLPDEEHMQKLLFEIAIEAITNSVRHGYATEIFVVSTHKNGNQILEVTDNGIPKEGALVEGGGFTGMRRKAAELGGSFSYETTPHFTVRITIPDGGAT